MQTTSVNLQADDLIQIDGELYFDNMLSIYQKVITVASELEKIKIDLIKLLSLDSSSLVLITSLIKFAKQHNKKITFVNLSKNLKDLARVNGVDTILPTDNIWL